MNCTLNYDSEKVEQITIFVCSKCLFGIVSGNDCVAVYEGYFDANGFIIPIFTLFINQTIFI